MFRVNLNIVELNDFTLELTAGVSNVKSPVMSDARQSFKLLAKDLQQINL
jgi:hypothetical protein